MKDSIGSFKFPHSWTGCLPLKLYIETVMHQLFLGNADSLFELSCKWASQKESIDISSAGFKRGIQPLLRDLKLLQLSWLLVYPFNGKPTDYKTGGWVSENWLSFVRIFPVVFGWFWGDYEKGLKNGVPDLARTILSFHAFVSRCMTHGGVNRVYIEETSHYLKEFMSCLFEFDILVRFRSLKVAGKEEEERTKTAGKKEKKEGPKQEAWWLKSNFMSLLNLIPTMEELGPLILWWDGGGKGERFIQTIKPHIKKGVREDAPNFFVGLMEKIYRHKVTELLEQRYGLTAEVGGKGEMEDAQTLNDALMAA